MFFLLTLDNVTPMKNKKKYVIGSIQIFDVNEYFDFPLNVEASTESSPDAPSYYPFDGEKHFSDFSKFEKVAMAGPFTSP